MVKKVLFAVFLFSFSISMSGQLSKKSKIGYGMSFGVGNSTLENSRHGVLSGSLTSLKFNIDFSFTKDRNTKLISGIEFLNFSSTFYNGQDQSKLENGYLQIPFKLIHRLNLNKTDKLNLITGIGTYVNVLLKSNIKSLTSNLSNSKGVNFGYNAILGMEYDLSENTSIRINGDLMNEFSAIKKNGYEQKQTGIVVFNIGLTTVL